MKNLIMLGVMSFLVSLNVQASEITLKDGRTITGDILQQDKTKMIVNVGGTSLTYFKDQILSVNTDADKQKLVEQYASLAPMRDIIVHWVNNKYPPDQRRLVLSLLDRDQSIKALTRMRNEALMQHLSAADLKTGINFYSSPEGRQFNKDLATYQFYIMRKIYSTIGIVAKKIPVKGVDSDCDCQSEGS